MVERAPAGGVPGINFCPQCGTRVPPDARFCAGCGRALASLLAPVAETRSAPPRAVAGGARAALPLPGARGWREQLPGLVVLALFLAVGLGVWVTILRGGAPASSAPSRQAPPTASGEMPPGHPPTTLPEEAKKFIASLADKAQAAPNDVAAWKSLAQVQMRAAEIDPSYAGAAGESYKHVLTLAPDDDEAIHGLGNVYYDQERYADAAEQYERYLRAHPDDPSVRTDLGTTYLYQRKFEPALAAYETVIKAHPDFLQAHFNLGLAYEAMGRRDEARKELATARGLAGDDATRTQIDRVTAQLNAGAGAPGGADVPGMSGGAPAGPAAGPPAAGAGMAPSGAAPAMPPGMAPAAGSGSGSGKDAKAMAQATDFRGAVEAGLRAHPILGPKISAIEWPSPTSARVKLADFPVQSMPDFARNLFRARLETILDDAKTRFPTSAETSIELVDAANGATMERVTH